MNVWPTNMTSMRVAYGDTNVLRCSVQFAYDRFFTTFNYDDINAAVESTYFNLLSSKEQAAANSLKDSYDVGNTWPLSPEGQKQLEAFNKSKDYVSPFERKHGKKQKTEEQETVYLEIPKGVDIEEMFVIKDKGNMVLQGDLKGDVRIKINNF